jgi:hypothetical protein
MNFLGMDKKEGVRSYSKPFSYFWLRGMDLNYRPSSYGLTFTIVDIKYYQEI